MEPKKKDDKKAKNNAKDELNDNKSKKTESKKEDDETKLTPKDDKKKSIKLKEDKLEIDDKVKKDDKKKSVKPKDDIKDNKLTDSKKPKKKIFNLTSYEELIHSQKIIKVDNTQKKEITSKTIVKLLLKEGISSVNEEMIFSLLRISKAGISKQIQICSELINSIKILIESTRIDTPSIFISDIKEKVCKILSIVNKLTFPIGGLDNTATYIKTLLKKIPQNKNPVEVKEIMAYKLEEFINTKINTKEIIANNRGNSLIKENDCILVYGKSKIFRSIFRKANDSGINFRVIYVDNRQEYNFMKEVDFYSQLGISVTYTFINGISGVIDKVTKVFIKAKSMLSNGSLLGAVGTSLVSCIAYNFKKPVIAFSETFKFWDKIQMNSLQSNNLSVENINSKDANINYMKMLYDITPANYINMVICELGYIPPTSVPVVIREFGQEDIDFE